MSWHLPQHLSAAILYGKLEVVLYRTGLVAARFLHGRVVRAVWVELERPHRRDKPCVQRLLIGTDPALSAQMVISGYTKRWATLPRVPRALARGMTVGGSRCSGTTSTDLA